MIFIKLVKKYVFSGKGQRGSEEAGWRWRCRLLQLELKVKVVSNWCESESGLQLMWRLAFYLLFVSVCFFVEYSFFICMLV